jgi:protein TonB
MEKAETKAWRKRGKKNLLALFSSALATGLLFLAIPLANGALSPEFEISEPEARFEIAAVEIASLPDAPRFLRRSFGAEKIRPLSARSSGEKEKPNVPPAHPADRPRYAAVEVAPRVFKPSSMPLDPLPPIRLRPAALSDRLVQAGTSLSKKAVFSPEEKRKESFFEPIDADKAERPPRKLFAPQPAYPSAASRRGIEGAATLSFVIGTDGCVSDCRVISTEGHPSFGEAARAAVETWRFEPALDRGRPVPVRAVQKISFRFER